MVPEKSASSDQCKWPSQAFLFFGVFAFCTLIKVFLASLGHGFDVGAWYEVSRITRESGYVYGRYEFYNYGPIWAWILAPIGYFSEWLPLSRSAENFHMWVALFLSCVDAALALVLRSTGNLRASYAFLLSPVTWLVSGFVAQFDQLPVFFGLLAVLALARAETSTKGRAAYLAGFILLMVISLATKHSLLFFPAWAAFWWLGRRERDYATAFGLVALPLVGFLLSFLPFWFDPAAQAGIVKNVFGYRSNYLHSLFPQVLDIAGLLQAVEEWLAWVPLMPGYRFLWVAAVLGVGWLCRRREALEAYAIYLVSFVAFSPGIYGQYLVIPALACAIFWRYREARLYTLAATLYLLFYSLRKMPFLRETFLERELGFVSFLSRHYEALPKYFPLVFLVPLLWLLLRESAPELPVNRPVKKASS